MFNEMRPIAIRSRYQTFTCSDCDAPLTIDMDAPGKPSPVDLGDHNDDCPQLPEPAVAEEMFKALAVIVRTPAIHALLAEHDPMALDQAKKAMMAYGGVYGSERCRPEWLGREKFRRVICETTEGAIRDRLLSGRHG